MSIPALFISTLALLFTVFSFWWMNWRKGKLLVSGPRSYAAMGSLEGGMIIEFPLVFFNSGAAPIIVQNLRLLFLQEIQPRPLSFIATVKKLGKDEDRSMATQFPVRGRAAVTLVCEFQRNPGNVLFEARTYPMELQAKLNSDRKWKQICRFPLRVSEQSLPEINARFLTYDNIVED
jgi:hypothetical protein